MSNLWAGPAQFDRMDEVRRDPDRVAELWRTAELLSVAPQGGLAAVDAGDGHRLATAVAEGPYDPELHLLLGRRDGSVVFMTPSEVPDARTIRELGPDLEPAELELATMAAAVSQWHALEPHCPRCGGDTTVIAAGSARRCAQCDREFFPRTDPAVIVAVTDADDRILLGHQGVWPEGRYSVLAGFVEAGESLEQAVHREVLEEVGVRLLDVTYVASQPWPFPRSIMLGFRATAIATDVVVDGVEIVEARWFARDELVTAVAEGRVGLPGPASIAHRLISDWLGSEQRTEP